MTEQEALARLRRMVDADSEPTLSDEDLLDCLERSKVVDSNGLPPSDPDWEPTWQLALGAVEGWMRKAGKLAGAYNVRVDGAQFDRGQMHEHCLRMADYYRRRLVHSIPLGSGDYV